MVENNVWTGEDEFKTFTDQSISPLFSVGTDKPLYDTDGGFAVARYVAKV